jgi:hypothetical protein
MKVLICFNVRPPRTDWLASPACVAAEEDVPPVKWNDVRKANATGESAP